MLVRVAGKYTVQFTAERHGVGCELTVDGNAGTYYGPGGTADKPRPEPWENHCSRQLDKALARLAKREFGFECYPPSPLA